MEKCIGTREALGLPDIGYDTIAPTLRSGLTGPRQTTSILSSSAALKKWNKLKIWPNGVQVTKHDAAVYPAKDNHYRLSLEDCAILQGFPTDWKFEGPAYMGVGVIGNSVIPPVAYNLALAISKIL